MRFEDKIIFDEQQHVRTCRLKTAIINYKESLAEGSMLLSSHQQFRVDYMSINDQK